MWPDCLAQPGIWQFPPFYPPPPSACAERCGCGGDLDFSSPVSIGLWAEKRRFWYTWVCLTLSLGLEFFLYASCVVAFCNRWNRLWTVGCLLGVVWCAALGLVVGCGSFGWRAWSRQCARVGLELQGVIQILAVRWVLVGDFCAAIGDNVGRRNIPLYLVSTSDYGFALLLLFRLFQFFLVFPWMDRYDPGTRVQKSPQQRQWCLGVVISIVVAFYLEEPWYEDHDCIVGAQDVHCWLSILCWSEFVPEVMENNLSTSLWHLKFLCIQMQLSSVVCSVVSRYDFSFLFPMCFPGDDAKQRMLILWGSGEIGAEMTGGGI